MKPFYLVGEPMFDPRPKEEYFAPVGQAELCLKVLQETQDFNEVLARLREEYTAIIWMLKQMGIEFRILYAHGDLVDEQTLDVCMETFQCKLVGLPAEFFPPSIVYPRDFSVLLGKTLLVNSEVGEILVGEKGGYKIIASPYGEGGRVLHARDVVLVSERMVGDKGSRPADLDELSEITGAGMRVGLLSPPMVQMFTKDGVQSQIQFNDHVDRVGCLISGKDGGLHHVVDPQIHTIDWKGTQAIPWVAVKPRETLEKLKRICEPLEVTVHSPRRRTLVPYSLNLLQIADGRVLMTGGDEPVAEVVSEIVGEENVFQTPIPIRFLPTWAYAGIRCIVTEAPLPLLVRA